MDSVLDLILCFKKALEGQNCSVSYVQKSRENHARGQTNRCQWPRAELQAANVWYGKHTNFGAHPMRR